MSATPVADSPLRVGLVQLNTRHDVEENLTKIDGYVADAARDGARLVCLPEYANYLGPDDRYAEVAERLEDGPTTERFASLAREHHVYLLGGSIREQTDEPERFYNTSVLFSPEGEKLAVYRKIHLFDVKIGDAVDHLESKRIKPGTEIVASEIDGWCAGLSVCYDLRFPELYRELIDKGAHILFVPAAFTMFTGKDHWETLLRARAIESQAFVLAPAQMGRHEPDGWCYGRSMVIDPWGNVLTMSQDTEGVVVAELDPELLKRLRTEVPSLTNRRMQTESTVIASDAPSGAEGPAVV